MRSAFLFCLEETTKQKERPLKTLSKKGQTLLFNYLRTSIVFLINLSFVVSKSVVMHRFTRGTVERPRKKCLGGGKRNARCASFTAASALQTCEQILIHPIIE